MMKPVYPVILVLTCIFTSSQAEEKKPGLPEAIPVRVETGTAAGELRFVPDKLHFERGKYYKLVVHIPGNMDHYFSSEGMCTHVYMHKVEVMDNNGETLPKSTVLSMTWSSKRARPWRGISIQ